MWAFISISGQSDNRLLSLDPVPYSLTAYSSTQGLDTRCNCHFGFVVTSWWMCTYVSRVFCVLQYVFQDQATFWSYLKTSQTHTYFWFSSTILARDVKSMWSITDHISSTSTCCKKKSYINFMLLLKSSILMSSPHTERKSDSFTIHQKLFPSKDFSPSIFQIGRPFLNDISSMSLDLRICSMILGVVIEAHES